MGALKNAIIGNIPFYALSSVAVALLVSGFLCPPLAIIDKSVLFGVAEIFGFAALWALVRAIDNGLSAKLTKGDTTIEIEK